MPKALDVCSGLGGWSDGLSKEGFEILGIEINQEIAGLYKHPVIVEDIRKLNAWPYNGKFDLVVGSTPCRDFSRMCDHATRSDGTIWKWKEPKNPERGYELVKHFLRIVFEVNPRFWLLENVKGLEEYCIENELPPGKARCEARLAKNMVRCFWGNYPAFLIPKATGRKKAIDIQGPLRRWERGRIPLPVARSLGRAINFALRE